VKRVNLSTVTAIIIPAMLVVQAARMVGAFVASDMQSLPVWLSGLLTILTGVSGAAQAVVFVAGQIVMLDGWKRGLPHLKWKNGRMVTLTAIIALTLAMEGVILVPYIHGRMTGESVAQYNVLAWIWAGAVVMAPTLVIAGVMMCNVTENATAKVQDATHMQNHAVQDAAKKVYQCPDCGEWSSNAGNHARWCEARKARKDGVK
jgi:hypothetical protein